MIRGKEIVENREMGNFDGLVLLGEKTQRFSWIFQRLFDFDCSIGLLLLLIFHSIQNTIIN